MLVDWDVLRHGQPSAHSGAVCFGDHALCSLFVAGDGEMDCDGGSGVLFQGRVKWGERKEEEAWAMIGIGKNAIASNV